MERVAELMKQEIMNIILKDIKDPRVGFVTVTKVKMTKDMRNARVFVSLMGSDEEKRASMEGLESSLGYIQREAGSRVQLRYTPVLSLAIDDTLEHGAHIQKLIEDIAREGAGR